ncbi:MAG TPA: extracellular solute-binding protein [Chloroflexota bacterium]|jgi:multiple sugar transport system substrate-binding protein
MKSIGRRRFLRWSSMTLGLGAAAPLLQACGAQAPAAPPTPQVVTKEVIVEKPVERVVTQVVEKPVTKEVIVTKEVQVQVTPTPLSKAKITGNLQIIQQRGFNPLQTTFIHNLLIKTATANGWPLDKSYIEGFTAGTSLEEKLSAQIAAGDSPDMIIGDIDTYLNWNLKNLQPADDMVEWATKQYGEPSPGHKLEKFIEGKWWAIPYWNATGGFWARKSWFDEVGVDIKKTYSLDEWRQHALKVSNADKKRWGWGNTVNRSGDGNTNVGVPVYQAGGRLTTADNKVAFNSPETVEAYEWLKDLYTNKQWASMLPPGVLSWTDPSNNEAYLAGTIGFSSNGGTMFATAMKQKPDIAADTHYIPHPNPGVVGKKENQIVSGPYYFEILYFRGAKNLDAAKEMTQLLLSKENQVAVWDNSPGLATPAYQWGWDEKTFQQVPNNVIGISKELMYSDKLFRDYLPGSTPKLWIAGVASENVLTDTAADVLKGTPAKDAVANAHARMQKILEKFEGK